MHTSEELEATDFEYRMEGRSVPRDEVMPAVGLEGRLGVVMGSGTDGIGAGNFVLSCVTAFYDRLRETREEFFEYPDYYTFQATDDPADYGMLDVYPAHKNVVVEPDDEQLLRAINDRAVDVLLVPTGPTRPPDVDDVTRRSAERRIEHCYLYAPDGRPDRAEFSIRQPREPAVDWYEATADSVDGPAPGTDRASFDSGENHVSQGFRRLGLERALSRLPGVT